MAEQNERAFEWRDAGEERPEDGQYVLVCGLNRTERVVVRCAGKYVIWQGEGEFRDAYGNRLRSVSHWMPLPEPPEELAALERAASV